MYVKQLRIVLCHWLLQHDLQLLDIHLLLEVLHHCFYCQRMSMSGMAQDMLAGSYRIVIAANSQEPAALAALRHRPYVQAGHVPAHLLLLSLH